MTNEIAICNLVFLVQGNEVILARGLKGFNKGYRAGYGGKVEPDESRESAAERECKEESTVTIELERSMLSARITFISQGIVDGFGNSAKKRICDIYVVREWSGTPSGTKAMSDPRLFAFDALPWKNMPRDYKPWLVDVLLGQHFEQTIWMQGDTTKVAMAGIRTALCYT